MIRTLHVYDFDGTPDWAELRREFPKNTCNFGGPYFVAGSEQEARFQRYCRDHGLSPYPQTILEYRGPEPRDAGLFLYLCLKGDKNGANRSERTFGAGDLSPVDFQMCDLYEASNVGRFHIMSPFPIISQRVFDVLLRNKIKGLFRYCTDPPIKHVVVQTRAV